MSTVADIVLAIGVAVVILGLTAAAVTPPARRRPRGERSPRSIP